MSNYDNNPGLRSNSTLLDHIWQVGIRSAVTLKVYEQACGGGSLCASSCYVIRFQIRERCYDVLRLYC